MSTTSPHYHFFSVATRQWGGTDDEDDNWAQIDLVNKLSRRDWIEWGKIAYDHAKCPIEWPCFYRDRGSHPMLSEVLAEEHR